MAHRLGWGILGTGKAAHLFAEGLSAVEGAEIRAVASRSGQRAADFAREFSVPRHYGSYEALIERNDIDVVYVATPHSDHLSNTLACLDHGRHVLCEKPMALNARQATEMIGAARRKKLFLMEAMWMLTLPAMQKLREMVRLGYIGEIRLVRTVYSFSAEPGLHKRLFSLDCGGGALMDIGVYGIAFAQRIFGQIPVEIAGLADMGESGVDERSIVNLRYDNGALANILSSIRDDWNMEGVIQGSEGFIRVPGKISRIKEFVLTPVRGQVQRFRFDTLGNGYSHEAVEVGRCLREGKLESEVVPLEESITVLQTMDRIRELWNLRFPGE
ncbi:MAG: Gfo/Idh/MocA family oxidoreductase [Spirochaetaceae bacterium]|nr:MAG: Gfo/Idh/MocA family oxidoreductase [Spirochaetaceae bacterium]